MILVRHIIQSFEIQYRYLRGWKLIQNFTPYNPRTVKKLNGFKSPAERLNQFRYHNNSEVGKVNRRRQDDRFGGEHLFKRGYGVRGYGVRA